MKITNKDVVNELFSNMEKVMDEYELHPDFELEKYTPTNFLYNMLPTDAYKEFMDIMLFIKDILCADKFKNVPKDTVIAVKSNRDSKWKLRKFSHVEYNIVYCYKRGMDSTQTSDTTAWEQFMLLDEDTLGKIEFSLN